MPGITAIELEERRQKFAEIAELDRQRAEILLALGQEREANLPKPWMRTFLEAYRLRPSIGPAAKSAGVTYATVVEWQKKSARFQTAMLETREMAIDSLEERAWERATSVVNPSDPLLMFMLRSLRRDIYGDRKEIETSVGPSKKGPAVVEVRAIDYRVSAAALAPPPEDMAIDADYRMLPEPVPAN